MHFKGTANFRFELRCDLFQLSILSLICTAQTKIYLHLLIKCFCLNVASKTNERLCSSNDDLRAALEVSLFIGLSLCFLVAWSSTYCSNLNCIYLLQRRILRSIAKASFLANTAPLFCQLRLLDIFSINSFYDIDTDEIPGFLLLKIHILLFSLFLLYYFISEVHNISVTGILQ